MSYAIEAKKRKFERILESLTDTTPSSLRTPLGSRDNAVTTISNQPNSIDVSKRRRVTPSSIKNLVITPSVSLSAHYLPSSRSAFLDRLQTYRNVTKWHVPSTSTINASEWARRGWLCQDTDTVICPSCKEKLLVSLDLQDKIANENASVDVDEHQLEDEEDSLSLANAVYENLIKRYYGMIITSHKEGCPWRRRGCDDSIQRIEGLLNSHNALSGLETRYDSMSNQMGDIPHIASLPSTNSSIFNEKELDRFTLPNTADHNNNILKLAICGWQRKDDDVVECRNCFRSLGMWLYRGDDPTMERLDPIDSHLEYCPWRSPAAQHTEVAIDKTQNKEKIPGWSLVYTAIVRDNHKRRGVIQTKETENSAQGDLSEAATNETQNNLTPQQREKKMQDLVRRVRELKQSFNVKVLLRKKEKAVVSRPVTSKR